MKAVVLAVIGACLSFLAFPPYGPGVLIFPGLALFLWALLEVGNRRHALWVGFLYGLVFFGGFMWWMAKLELIALVLIPVQAVFFAFYAWWLASHGEQGPGKWMVLAVGGWSVMELIRYHFPVGGMEWGAAGYALSDNVFARQPAAVVGTSGLTVLVVLVAAVLAQLVARRAGRAALWAGVGVVLVVFASYAWLMAQDVPAVGAPVTIVQGSTPCPFEHCPPDERLRTYGQHLELTRSLQPATAGLVVWPEGSTGSTNADPVLNDEIREAIAAEARRLGSRMVVGGDRVVSDTDWINANVYFDSDGEIVGEYRKQHPVPFGEYIPLRPLFDWIPALDRVPRDMIRGDGPVLMGEVGSVISWEGGFSRYALETRRAGAEVIIVNTNTASYGIAPTSDIWIGMTRMRAVELGVPIIHAAVTGKSTVVDIDGSVGPVTGLAEMVVLQDTYRSASLDTPYTATGDVVIYLAAILGIVAWSNALVGSRDRLMEEE
ncbi:MAG TPA: apolipoprotein N-acyltransferase [Acidimicrobiia bacterium]|nr:apolipoprotein N-acyltransferase [Acidimicrobiia bacterium]